MDFILSSRSVLGSIAQVLILGLAGLFILRQREGDACLGALSSFVINCTLPCLIFSEVLKEFDPASFPGWWLIPIFASWLATARAILSSFT